MYKEIKKTELLDMNAGQLSLYSTITGAAIGEGYTPLTGRYITIDGTRHMERAPKDSLFVVDYEQYDTGQIIRIRIGSIFFNRTGKLKHTGNSLQGVDYVVM